MKKTLASLLAAAMIALTLTATATDASAQWRGWRGGCCWRGGGWGWGAGVAAGAIGGAVIAGAIIASRPPGYVVYPGYAEPVYGPGCYWASQPVYNAAGRIVGYTAQPVQVCPGYVPPPPPGYAGPPPPDDVAPPRPRRAAKQQVQSKEDSRPQALPKEDGKPQVQPNENSKPQVKPGEQE